MGHILVGTIDQLRALTEPVRAGGVAEVAFDTETTEVVDDRFTAFGTDVRMAGFSLSWGDDVDLYVPVRHRPYDWRRRPDLIERDAEHDGQEWMRVLRETEGVALPAPGCAPRWDDEGPGDPNLPLGDVLEVLAELMALPTVSWGAHNWPFDAKVLIVDGIEPPWDRLDDTQVWSVLTDPRQLDAWDERESRWVHGGHSLKHLGEVHLGRDPNEEDLVKAARKVLQCDDYSMLPLRHVIAPYAAQDTRLVLDVKRHVRGRKAFADPAIQELARKHHTEIRVSVGMERGGVNVDCGGAVDAAASKESELAEIQLRARTAAGGRDVPLSNPQQLQGFLWTELGLPTYRNATDTKKATLKQVRRKIAAGESPMPAEALVDDTAACALLDSILDYRRAYKELTSFYRPLTCFGSEGVVHPILNPLRARTTRYSAEKPNIQQMPKKGKVRALFKPPPGGVILALDYGGQEMRVGAHYALAIPQAFEYRFSWRCTLERRGDCKGRAPHGPGEVHIGYRTSYSKRPPVLGLVDGFMSGDAFYDPHQSMVERCHAQGLEWIDRDTGKTANFAILYGAGPKKVAETLDCSFGDAQALVRIFWDKAYPELGRVRTFIDERLRRKGPDLRWSGQDHIKTLHGGHIYLESGYKGLNYLVQRSCREILLNALLLCDAYVREQGLPYRMLFPVHDEVVWTAPACDLDQAHVRELARLMVVAGFKSQVPMVVEPKVGRENWAEMESMPAEWGYNGVREKVV